MDDKVLTPEERVEEFYTKILNDESLPAIEKQVEGTVRALSREDTGLQQAAAVIGSDYSLALKVLRTSNTFYYNRTGSPILNTAHAMMRLGTEQVRAMARSLILIEQYKEQSPGLKELLLLSMLAAEQCRNLAEKVGLDNLEEAYLCGMYRNLGELLIACHATAEFSGIMTLVRQGDTTLDACSKVLGFAYEDLGAFTAKKWKLPLVAKTITSKGGKTDKLAALVQLSHEFTDVVYRQGSNDPNRIQVLLEKYADDLNLDRKEIRTVLDEAITETSQTFKDMGVEINDLALRRTADHAISEESGEPGQASPAEQARPVSQPAQPGPQHASRQADPMLRAQSEGTDSDEGIQSVRVPQRASQVPEGASAIPTAKKPAPESRESIDGADASGVASDAATADATDPADPPAEPAPPVPVDEPSLANAPVVGYADTAADQVGAPGLESIFGTGESTKAEARIVGRIEAALSAGRSVDLNKVLLLSLEGILNLGIFDHTIYCQIDKSRASVQGRLGLGDSVDMIVSGLRVPLDPQDVIGSAIGEHRDYFIGAHRSEIESEAVVHYNAGSLGVMPIVSCDKLMGCFFVSTMTPRPRPTKDMLSRMYMFRNFAQKAFGLRLLGRVSSGKVRAVARALPPHRGKPAEQAAAEAKAQLDASQRREDQVAALQKKQDGIVQQAHAQVGRQVQAEEMQAEQVAAVEEARLEALAAAASPGEGDAAEATAEQKSQIVLRWLAGEPISELSAEIGVPVLEIEKWQRDFMMGAMVGLRKTG